jgi:hypothetical protein
MRESIFVGFDIDCGRWVQAGVGRGWGSGKRSGKGTNRHIQGLALRVKGPIATLPPNRVGRDVEPLQSSKFSVSSLKQGLNLETWDFLPAREDIRPTSRWGSGEMRSRLRKGTERA